MTYDAAIIGAGISGMTVAARLQSQGLRTLLLEAHGRPGGCAGYFTTRGFSFDVGATTFVDFEPGGVGGEFCRETGIEFEGERLPGYVAWLPDGRVTLYRDRELWKRERSTAFGDDPGIEQFWAFIDRLSDVFWQASRSGLSLPIRTARKLLQAVRSLPPSEWPLARHLRRTMADALRSFGLDHSQRLRALLGMLIQDTVHSSVDEAPLINSALGITIRGAGLTRPVGGARGFWDAASGRYRELGGTLKVGRRVESVKRTESGFDVKTRKETYSARRLISTLPIWNTAELGLSDVADRLKPYMKRDRSRLGGALVLHLGVPEPEVACREFTHHQVLVDYDAPMGDGNNMFISVSAPNDRISAPEGYRAVMISTHCELNDWRGISRRRYDARRQAAIRTLLANARRVYPDLGTNATILRLGTPLTYERYTGRYLGAVGGTRLTLRNANQHAVPHDIGVPGVWIAGDTTWPGLGTVAGVLAGRAIADDILSEIDR